MSVRTWLGLLLAALVAGGLAGAVACGDPVHDAEVSALGPEASGVPAGPTHRPGQPCLTCHGGMGPASSTFVTAGTVYIYPSPSSVPLAGGSVELVDSVGSAFAATTNVVGNFFVTPDEWNPVFPIGGLGQVDAGAVPHVISIPPPACPAGTMPPACPTPLQMVGAIERGGVYASCAYCHFDPPGLTSPGHVYQQYPPAGTP